MTLHTHHQKQEKAKKEAIEKLISKDKDGIRLWGNLIP
ncbi:hypothetical protein CFSAN002069_24620 (plasmid) [Salmonella enterica subsp. enterica serovar Heidelberg str. CFSAN002069]|nr:hypothetical protein CFSAN002069_24620 [Salmonella enterica subsp. enterica serovar Heidelberg str. CFSAN002069]